MISAMRIESFTKRMDYLPLDKLVVVIGDRVNVQEVAVQKGVRVLIVTGEEPIDPKIIEAAKKNRVSLISSPHDTLTTASLCRSAVAIRHMLNEEFLSFREDAPLSAVRAEAAASRKERNSSLIMWRMATAERQSDAVVNVSCGDVMMLTRCSLAASMMLRVHRKIACHYQHTHAFADCDLLDVGAVADDHRQFVELVNTPAVA